MTGDVPCPPGSLGAPGSPVPVKLYLWLPLEYGKHFSGILRIFLKEPPENNVYKKIVISILFT